MPSINPNFYKEIRRKYNKMTIDFKRIKNDYTDLNSGNYWGEPYHFMYSISDFYDFYEPIKYDLDSLFRSQTLLTKEEEYKKINDDVVYMLHQVKMMYQEMKRLIELSGGFTNLEIEGISTFRIDKITY